MIIAIDKKDAIVKIIENYSLYKNNVPTVSLSWFIAPETVLIKDSCLFQLENYV